jgi:hypothetical protein
MIMRFMAAGFAAFGLAIALYSYLMKVSPTLPDPPSGRVCPMYEHGYVFFVTPDQRIGFCALFGIFALLVIIATVLSIRWKEFRSWRDYRDLFRNI